MTVEKNEDAFVSVDTNALEIKQKNPKSKKPPRVLLIAAGIIAGLVIPLMIFYLLSTFLEGKASGTDADEPDIQGEVAEMLPQMVRASSGSEGNMKIRDPFVEPGILSGILRGNNGYSLVIIETPTASYVAAEGDLIDGYWTVKDIAFDMVILEARGEYLYLKLTDELKPGVIQSGNESSGPAGTTFSGNESLRISKDGSIKPGDGTDASQISVDVRNADIRDVLSALAVFMDVEILLVEEPDDVFFHVRNQKILDVLELFLQKEGLSYLKEDKLLIVGSTSKLESDFFNRIALTRFDMQHISAQFLEDALLELTVPVKSIRVDNNEKAIWIQATPQSLSMVRKVISEIDRPENADTETIVTLSRYRLQFIHADSLIEIASQLNIDIQGVIMENNPQVIWVHGTRKAKNKLESLIEDIDVYENREDIENLNGFQLKHVGAETLQRLASEVGIEVYTVTLRENPNTLWVYGTDAEKEKLGDLIAVVDVPENAEGSQPLVRFDLFYITLDNLEEMIDSLGISLQIVHVKENNPKTFWAIGSPGSLEKLKELIAAVDVMENEDENFRVFVYQLEHTVPRDIEVWLQSFGFDDVRTITFNFSEFGRDIMVITPPHIEHHVYDAIAELDDVRRDLKIPVASGSSYSALVAQRSFLNELIPGISMDSMMISDDLSGEEQEPVFILWFNGTTEMAQKITDMVEMIGIISGP